MTAPAIHPHLLRLSALIDLERRARDAAPAELPYFMVNETLAVVPYQQAALWRRGRVGAVSGVSSPDESGPYHMWLTKALAAAGKLGHAGVVDAAALDLDPAAWAEWFPPEAFWLPLNDRRGHMLGGLLLGRQDPWHAAEVQLLEAIGGTYALCLAVADRPRRYRRAFTHRRSWLWLGGLAIAAAASMIPIRASVLAPAEVVAATPFPVRAPFDGVVDSIHVTPNAPVHKGDVLISFDTTERRAKAEVAQKALEIARAEYAEASQQAMNDARTKGRLAILQSKVSQAVLEYEIRPDHVATRRGGGAGGWCRGVRRSEPMDRPAGDAGRAHHGGGAADQRGPGSVSAGERRGDVPGQRRGAVLSQRVAGPAVARASALRQLFQRAEPRRRAGVPVSRPAG